MEDDEDTSVLGQIISSTKQEGYTPGTPEFERRLRQLKVSKCREMRGHTTCQECPANDVCELYIQVKRDHYGI